MNLTNTVKSLNFMGMKFRGLTIMDMIVGQLNFWILNYRYMQYNYLGNKYFVGIFSSWIALPMINRKLNVQQYCNFTV